MNKAETRAELIDSLLKAALAAKFDQPSLPLK